jgi:hypothetical protein
MADEGVRRAMETICKLARDGHSATVSSDLFRFLSQAVQCPRPAQDYERDWARDTGKSWKQLTEFPDRLRGIAEEVEGLSRSKFFDPARAIISEMPLAVDQRREFPILPKALRNYANWLKGQIELNLAFRKHYGRWPRKHSHFIRYVSEEVKSITGRYCDREVADLLNAADRVVNPGNRDNKDRLDEQTIALLRSRQNRKTPKT